MNRPVKRGLKPCILSVLSAVPAHTYAVEEARPAVEAAVAPAGTGPLEPAVEANARLTASTGLLLVVMLAAEGVTVASIGPLLPWHIGIGLALVPPVLVKMGSTIWRFCRYYMGDAGYRRAGPPHPILRALGPLVTVSTAVVLASGIAAWLAGPPAHTLIGVHKASFVVWFAAMTLHVLGHALRATRLAGPDWGRRALRPAAGSVRLRRGLVVASLVAGAAIGVGTRGVMSGWSVWAHAR